MIKEIQVSIIVAQITTAVIFSDVIFGVRLSRAHTLITHIINPNEARSIIRRNIILPPYTIINSFYHKENE